MNLFLIRHGRTKGNLEHRYVGRTDESILPEERERLEEKRKALKKLLENRRTVIYASPMRRCLETAEILFERRAGDPEVHIVQDFREMDFGEFEYKNYRELDADPGTAPAYQAYIDSGGEAAFPGGESRAQFEARTCRAADCIFRKYLQETDMAEDLNLVFLAHGGTMMAIMDHLSAPHRDYFQWQSGPGEGYLAEITNRHGRIRVENAVPILREEI